jgi:dihydrolipoamide dehydrogenase
VNDRHYAARAIIIATGSRPVVPDEWRALGDRLLTSDNLFEQPTLPRRLAVIGLGGVGLELAQALARLGVEVHGFEASGFVGGLTDPAVNEAAITAFGREFSIHTGVHAGLSACDGGVRVEAGERHVEVDKVLVALGRAPDSGALNLEALGLPLDDKGLPPFDTGTQQVGDLPVFIAGDVNGYRPLLHEAADEGYIAGCNAVRGQRQTFVRRTPLMICFSTPDIARAGASFASLKDSGIVTGAADFAGQGRARMSGRDQGTLRVYADAESGRLLGAEMCIPGGEHIAHLLAWSIQQRLALSDMLAMPYYHPTLEEGLRTAVRAAGKQLRKSQPEAQASACDQLPVKGLD